MDLTREEKAFLESRAKFARSWPIVGTAMLVGLLVLAGWLLFTRPMLINPWAVLSGLEAGTIPDSTLAVMAALLGVMLTCLFVVGVVLILFSVAFSNEKKHIAIIRRMTGASPKAPR